jgi:F-type H+-transporting ATPase subunit a
VLNLCKDVAGEHNGPRLFPIIVTIFLFVVVNAWMNLLPGIGSVTVHTEEGVVPLFRGANTDINTPLALAVVSFIMVEYLGFASGGFSYLKKFFNFGKLGGGFKLLFTGKVGKGFAGVGYGVIDAFVGILELLSEIFRLFSFTFRLFGNMLGGEILVLMMFFLVTYVLVIPFYGLELLVGAVQALIFSALTLVFASISSASHEEHS